jgi:hypothetical protein
MSHVPVSLLQEVRVPSTRSQLSTLQARRDELQSQIEALTERRGSLAQQRLNAEARVSAGATQDRKLVQEYNSQIDEIGARLSRLERELTEVNDAILQGTARVGGAAGGGGLIVNVPRIEAIPTVPQMPVFPSRFDRVALERQYQMMMMGEALFFVLLGVIGWRVLARRMRREAMQSTTSPDVAQLRNAVDAIAVEVERISEGQRYVTKLITERGEGVSTKPRG